VSFFEYCLDAIADSDTLGLLETKGIHREAPGKVEPADESSKTDSKDTSESGGKLSGLKDKIKAKLHKS
jgi:hypothetical protein